MARLTRTAAGALAVVAVGVAATVVLVVRSEVVQGPLTLHGRDVHLVTLTACLLALAAAADSVVLARLDFAWHTDGLLCGAVLVAMAAMVIAGWERAPDPFRSSGSVLAPLVVPPLLAVVERRARGTMRWAAAAAAVIGALSLGRYAVRDPFHDPDCWVDCSLENVAPLPSTAALRVIQTGLDVATSICAIAAVALTILVATRTTRRGAGVSWLDLAIAASAATAAASAAVAAFPTGRNTVSGVVAVGLMSQGAMALLVAGQPALALRRRRELRRLTLALGDQPPLGTLAATLGRMLGDPHLRVAYWLPESRRYVDTAGDPVRDDARAVVTLQRNGRPLARVYLDRPGLDSRELEDLVGSAARLAIDSERLQAEVRAQLAELLAARQRIVAAADDARRRVERTIHDDVQSELLGALFELGRATSQAEESGADGAAREVARMTEEVRELVSALREFARGVYPAVLDGSGLAAALAALADVAPVAMRIDCRGDGAFPGEAARAAYLLVHDAASRADTDLDVDLYSGDRRVVLTIVSHPGEVREDLADRVGALGGTVEVDHGILRAVLPCG